MNPFFATIRARPLLFGAVALGLVVALLVPGGLGWPTRCLIGWCVGTLLFAGLVSLRMSGKAGPELDRYADGLDEGAVTILVLSGAATVASFVAVAFELAGLQSLPANLRNLHLTLTLLTVVSSWLFIQTIFAVHYTHVFYAEDWRSQPPLDFGGEEAPDYWDFVYFAVTIGATSQTSDVNIRTRILRRIVAAHGVFSFFFNTTVLALAVNIAAGLL